MKAGSVAGFNQSKGERQFWVRYLYTAASRQRSTARRAFRRVARAKHLRSHSHRPRQPSNTARPHRLSPKRRERTARARRACVQTSTRKLSRSEHAFAFQLDPQEDSRWQFSIAVAASGRVRELR